MKKRKRRKMNKCKDCHCDKSEPKKPEIRLSVEEAKGICSIIACFIMGKPRNLEDYKGFESMNKQILQIEGEESKCNEI